METDKESKRSTWKFVAFHKVKGIKSITKTHWVPILQSCWQRFHPNQPQNNVLQTITPTARKLNNHHSDIYTHNIFKKREREMNYHFHGVESILTLREKERKGWFGTRIPCVSASNKGKVSIFSLAITIKKKKNKKTTNLYKKKNLFAEQKKLKK